MKIKLSYQIVDDDEAEMSFSHLGSSSEEIQDVMITFLSHIEKDVGLSLEELLAILVTQFTEPEGAGKRMLDEARSYLDRKQRIRDGKSVVIGNA